MYRGRWRYIKPTPAIPAVPTRPLPLPQIAFPTHVYVDLEVTGSHTEELNVKGISGGPFGLAYPMPKWGISRDAPRGTDAFHVMMWTLDYLNGTSVSGVTISPSATFNVYKRILDAVR